MCVFFQINIEWMKPTGPLNSKSCFTIDTIIPPPLPIRNITIIDTHIVSTMQDGTHAQKVTASVRSVAQCSFCFMH